MTDIPTPTKAFIHADGAYWECEGGRGLRVGDDAGASGGHRAPSGTGAHAVTKPWFSSWLLELSLLGFGGARNVKPG